MLTIHSVGSCLCLSVSMDSLRSLSLYLVRVFCLKQSGDIQPASNLSLLIINSPPFCVLFSLNHSFLLFPSLSLSLHFFLFPLLNLIFSSHSISQFPPPSLSLPQSVFFSFPPTLFPSVSFSLYHLISLSLSSHLFTSISFSFLFFTFLYFSCCS